MTRWVVRQVRLAALLDDAQAALVAATSYLVQLESCDSPLFAGVAARVGFQALALVGSMQGTRVDDLRDLATRQRERARAGLSDEWSGGYYGVQLALAEGYAARVGGDGPRSRSSGSQPHLSEPFGAFFALEPRLDLAQELLAHGGRDEGKELLVECWTAAHEMGARGLEQRAFRLATRSRVPLPESATSEGPLSRLTPRERAGARPARDRRDQQDDRGEALHQREDRECARVQPAGQARGREPRGSGGPGAQSGGVTGVHTGAATALLGRGREQAELFDALSLAPKADHQIVVVAGDAGAGKTTLVADLAQRRRGLGFTVAMGHCRDIEANISFAPVIEAVRRSSPRSRPRVRPRRSTDAWSPGPGRPRSRGAVQPVR